MSVDWRISSKEGVVITVRRLRKPGEHDRGWGDAGRINATI
jgi:hypothetical protein